MLFFLGEMVLQKRARQRVDAFHGLRLPEGGAALSAHMANKMGGAGERWGRVTTAATATTTTWWRSRRPSCDKPKP